MGTCRKGFGALAMSVALLTVGAASPASAASGPASFAGAAPSTFSDANRVVTHVQYRRGWRGHHHRRHRGWRGHRRHGINPGAAIIGGVAAALIAGAIRDGRARDYDIERCERRFRSFDPTTGTYTTYGGETRVCPYLR